MGTLIYRPGKADEQKWEWDPADPDFDIAYQTELMTDWPWDVFIAKFRSGSVIALQALIYAHLKRDNARIRRESVVVKFSDFDYELDVSESADPPEPDEDEKPKSKKKADKAGEA